MLSNKKKIEILEALVTAQAETLRKYHQMLKNTCSVLDAGIKPYPDMYDTDGNVQDWWKREK